MLEGEGVIFHLTFLVFKLEDFQHPGVRLKRLSLGSLGAYQKSMAWRMEKVSKMWDWQEILAHFCLIFTFLACGGSFSASGKSFSAKPLSDKSAQKIHFELACSIWDWGLTLAKICIFGFYHLSSKLGNFIILKCYTWLLWSWCIRVQPNQMNGEEWRHLTQKVNQPTKPLNDISIFIPTLRKL